MDAWTGGQWIEIAQGTSVGSCRIVKMNAAIETSRLRLRIMRSAGGIALREFGLFCETAI